MRKAVLILLFVSSPAFASSACETALTTSIAKVTEKAIGEHVVSIQEIAELVSAKEPFNPLRYRTPGSMNTSLSRFYQAMIAKHQTDGDWELVRAELARVLAKHAVGQGQVNTAKEETQSIPIFTLDDEITGIRGHNLTWYRLSDGRMLYSYFVKGKTIVRELGQKEVVGIGNGSGWVRENALGNPEFITVHSANKNLREWIRHPSLEKETLRMLDLKTNVTTEFTRFYAGENGGTSYIIPEHKLGSEIVVHNDSRFSPLVANKPYVKREGERHDNEVRYTGDTGFALQAIRKNSETGFISYKFIYFADGDWQDVNSQPVVLPWGAEKIRAFGLKDGRLAILATDSRTVRSPFVVMPFKGVPQEGFYLKTSHNDVNQIDLQQTYDNRIFVVTASDSPSPEWRGRSVEVFEPGAGATPFFKVNYEAPVQVATFTRGKHFYVLTQDKANGEILLYEPLSGDIPLQRIVLPGHLLGVFTDKQGQPFLIQDQIGSPSSITFHRIFGPG